MAVFSIKSINYIIGGTTEKIINVDLVDENNHIILNKTFITDEDSGLNKNISAECNTHRLYQFPEEISGVVYNDLFDFKDVAVKSDYYNTDNTAVFGPKLLKDPLGFAQGLNGNVYGATAFEEDSSIIAHTNLPDTRDNRLAGNTNSIIWHYKLSSSGDLTYTGPELTDLRYMHLDYISGQVSTVAVIPSSPYQYIENNTDKYAAACEFLKPYYNNPGLKRDYLYQIYVSNKKSNSDKWNEFNKGNIFGNVFVGKNFYDSKYSTAMIMSDNGKAFPIREYVKIGEAGGWPFFIYYDNRDLSSNSTVISTDYLPLSGGIRDGGNITERMAGTTKRKYQHVETVQSLNRFLNRGNHKSNLYSIRLKLDLDNLLPNTPENKKLLDTVKLDIRNSVRRITSNLEPAHTQLFKVYIDGK